MSRITQQKIRGVLITVCSLFALFSSTHTNYTIAPNKVLAASLTSPALSYLGPSITTSVSTTTTTSSTIPGCSSGFSFSITTGERCSSSLTAQDVINLIHQYAPGSSASAPSVIYTGTPLYGGTMGGVSQGDLQGVEGSVASLSSGITNLGSTTLGMWTKGGSGISYTGGNVGINTANPQAFLDVNGTIRAGNFYRPDNNTWAGRDESNNPSATTTNYLSLWLGGTPQPTLSGKPYANGIRLAGDVTVGLPTVFEFAGSDYGGSVAKDAIAFDPSGTDFYRGDLKFILNNSASSNQYSMSDTKMTIKANGNVGIGTTSPISTLTVVGSACISKGTGATATCSTTAGTITANVFNTAAADVAEDYVTQDSSIGAGDIIAIDPNTDNAIIKATPGSSILGIVSTNPGVLLGGTEASSSRPVALAGRVPVKVSMENGTIQRGDELTLSSTEPGVAMKYIPSLEEGAGGGGIIGVALSEATANGTVMVFVRGTFATSLSKAIGTSTAQTIEDNSISGFFQNLGMTLVQDVLSIKNIIADHITAKTATITNSIEMNDDTTGQPYCIHIHNGTLVSTPGSCTSNLIQSEPSISTSTASTTDVVVTGTPNQQGTQATTTDSNTSSDTSPIVSPTPSPTLTPSPSSPATDTASSTGE